MIAAEYGNNSIVDILLCAEADTTIRNGEGWNAIEMAIDSRFSSIAETLLPYTDKSWNSLQRLMVKACKQELADVVGRVILLADEGQMRLTLASNGFSIAAKYGSYKSMEVLLPFLGQNKSKVCADNLGRSIKSDVPEAVELVCKNIAHVPSEEIAMAEERGCNDVIDVINKCVGRQIIIGKGREQTLSKLTERKKKIEENVLEEVKSENIWNHLMKTEEFEYHVTLENIQKSISKEGKIQIKYLIGQSSCHSLQAPPVHFYRCDDPCRQRNICKALREALKIQRDLLRLLGEQFPVFKNGTAWPVGSLVEGTRLGQAVELDTNVALDKKYAQYLHFNKDKQNIVLAKSKKLAADDPLCIYFKSDVLDTKKIFDDFLFGLWKILGDYEVPSS